MDDEILRFAHQIDAVTIAPMKQMSEIKALLPKNVKVDLALGAELGYRSVGGSTVLRRVSAVVRALLPCPTPSEVTFRKVFGWAKKDRVTRADTCRQGGFEVRVSMGNAPIDAECLPHVLAWPCNGRSALGISKYLNKFRGVRR